MYGENYRKIKIKPNFGQVVLDIPQPIWILKHVLLFECAPLIAPLL